MSSIEQADKIISLAGNPNVGKSTLFNQLTGLHQHTGNWAGKTVSLAEGSFSYNGQSYMLVDLPGTYSLMSHSREEEIARDFICFGKSDGVIVVCDATCLEHNLNLLLQTIEISKNVILCVNLIDEAKKKGIYIDCEKLRERLGIPVFPIAARSSFGVYKLLDHLTEIDRHRDVFKTRYNTLIEKAIEMIEPFVEEALGDAHLPSRWVSLRLIEGDESLKKSLEAHLGFDIYDKIEFSLLDEFLLENELSKEKIKDMIVSGIVIEAEGIAEEVTSYKKTNYDIRDRRLDRILTGKYTAVPIMLLLLVFVFWLTISGANYPSEVLSKGLFSLEDKIYILLSNIGTPIWLKDLLLKGMFHVLAWVVSVMLPPMAIFFPLFTLLEDLGYLPRIAFNLDHYFRKCDSCGKQALTMTMGFGCNAAGVIGCRIIDSPRERLIAIITNSFVPCNGRFPTLISILTMFFIGSFALPFKSAISAMMLSVLIVIGIFFTFAASKLLSKTILKGVPSSFTLELPSYRKPQVLKVIVRSIFDRTLFVLGRAVVVALPAGAFIWVMANLKIDGITLLKYGTDFLDPFARLLGLDGVILMAFILGFPANEIVIPIMIMSYMAKGSMDEFESLAQLKELLLDNGWTVVTAICTMMFSLMHWPCSTTLLSIKKETGSLKWTAVSLILPMLFGFGVCFIINMVAGFFM